MFADCEFKLSLKTVSKLYYQNNHNACGFFFHVMNIIKNWEIDVMLPHGPSWDSRSDPQRGAGLYFEKLEKLCVEKSVTLSEKKEKSRKRQQRIQEKSSD